jgi:CheY-like chemotaxis protein
MTLPTPRAHDAALRVLIVDDNCDLGEMLAKLLGMVGHEAFVAVDGASAVAAATRLDPDVILLDLHLPDMDGYEAARRIREECRFTPGLVAITGGSSAEDRQRTKDAGFDAYLLKPVNPENLGKLLAEFNARRQTGGPLV